MCAIAVVPIYNGCAKATICEIPRKTGGFVDSRVRVCRPELTSNPGAKWAGLDHLAHYLSVLLGFHDLSPAVDNGSCRRLPLVDKNVSGAKTKTLEDRSSSAARCAYVC